MKITGYNRIMVAGNAGSGKSYLSKKISAITGLPVIHLDNEYWLPKWKRPPKDQWIEKHNKLVQGEKWIMDGNYNHTMEERFKAADLIIFLDINRMVCLLSILKRRGTKRSELPEFLDEKLDSFFLAFCRWIWTFDKTRKKTVFFLHRTYLQKPFLVIRSRQDMDELLVEWQTAGNP